MTKARKSSILTIVLLLMILMSSTVMAEGGRTVKVKSYDSNMFIPENLEDLITAQFSVSNVVEILDSTTIDDYIDEYLVVESPAVVTTLQDYPAIFTVYKLFIEDGEYRFLYDEVYPVDGEILIFVPNESGELDEYGDVKYVEKIVHTSELTDEQKAEMDFTFYKKGATVTLTEPGDYYASFVFEAAANSTEAFITVKDSGKKETPKAETSKEKDMKANPTASKVLVNGQETDFDAYLIGGNNYFKLRDLAHIISGSQKQFEVNWDGEKEAINLISNQPYTSLGGEMRKASGTEKKANLNTSKIYKDGQEVELSAYTIDGNNYFKLRDLGKAFNFGVGWDNNTKTITIDTSAEYTVE